MIVSTIAEQDPHALVLVFGDHGAYLSRGITPAEDSDFFYADRHLVSLAVLATDNPCANRKALSTYAPGYYTPSRAVAAIAKCLAGDTLPETLLNFDEPEPLRNLLTRHSMMMRAQP